MSRRVHAVDTGQVADADRSASPDSKDEPDTRAQFKIVEDVAGNYRWQLFAGDEVLATSEVYVSKLDARMGIDAARRAAGRATVYDDTE